MLFKSLSMFIFIFRKIPKLMIKAPYLKNNFIFDLLDAMYYNSSYVTESLKKKFGLYVL